MFGTMPLPQQQRITLCSIDWVATMNEMAEEEEQAVCGYTGVQAQGSIKAKIRLCPLLKHSQRNPPCPPCPRYAQDPNRNGTYGACSLDKA